MIKLALLLIFCSFCLHGYECDLNMRPAFEKTLELQEVKQLWEQINREGTVRIKGMQNGQDRFKAFWEGEQRIICVNLSLRPTIGEQISSLLFEMHNALRDQKALVLYNRAAKGEISKETFATEMERVEYHNSLDACNLLDKGVRCGLFPKECYLKRYPNFEEFLLAQKAHGHYQHYLRTWHEIQGATF